MTFVYSFVLLFLVLIPFVYKVLLRHELKRKAQLLTLSLAMLIIALSKPALQQTLKDVKYQGTEIIIAIDLSASMQAKDISPSRLGYIKEQLTELFSHEIKDKIALIGFTSSAIILSPMTNDVALLQSVVKRLKHHNIISKSTHIMPVLELSKDLSLIKHPNILLLSDGGEENFSHAINWCKENPISLYTLGVATKQGATLEQEDGSVLRTIKNEIVVSALNPKLEQLAQHCGGENFGVSTSLETVVQTIHEHSKEQFSSTQKQYQSTQLFYAFIALSLVLFLVAVTSLVQMLPVLVVMMAFGLPNHAQAKVLDFYHIKQANSAYKNKDYTQALEQYDAVDTLSWELLFNKADTLYRLGKFDKAIYTYKNIQTTNPKIKAIIYFNMGNAYTKRFMYENATEMYIKCLQLRHDTKCEDNLLQVFTLKNEKARPNHHQNDTWASDKEEAKASAKGKKKKGKSGSSQLQAGNAKQGAGSSKTNSKKHKTKIKKQSRSQGMSSKQFELINKGVADEKKPW